tara:strand:+ start:646 stop:1329 length:684 start_codon:yes stop_codon:yes gene_type:complete
MKKIYRVTLLFVTLVFLSTYTPGELNFLPKKKGTYFNVKTINVTNTSLIDSGEIIEKLNKIYDRNIFTINRDDIERPLESIYFLDKIDVKKKYPNTIIIKVYETKPIAIIYKDNKKFILDNSSNLIVYKEKMGFDNLPNIFGNGAESQFSTFFSKLEQNNFPKKKIKNYYYHQIGRWDLELFNDKIIKLPNDKVLKAIKKSVELLERDDFKNYNIIDLRIHGKIVVE